MVRIRKPGGRSAESRSLFWVCWTRRQRAESSRPVQVSCSECWRCWRAAQQPCCSPAAVSGRLLHHSCHMSHSRAIVPHTVSIYRLLAHNHPSLMSESVPGKSVCFHESDMQQKPNVCDLFLLRFGRAASRLTHIGVFVQSLFFCFHLHTHFCPH